MWKKQIHFVQAGTVNSGCIQLSHITEHQHYAGWQPRCYWPQSRKKQVRIEIWEASTLPICNCLLSPPNAIIASSVSLRAFHCISKIRVPAHDSRSPKGEDDSFGHTQLPISFHTSRYGLEIDLNRMANIIGYAPRFIVHPTSSNRLIIHTLLRHNALWRRTTSSGFPRQFDPGTNVLLDTFKCNIVSMNRLWCLGFQCDTRVTVTKGHPSRSDSLDLEDN